MQFLIQLHEQSDSTSFTLLHRLRQFCKKLIYLPINARQLFLSVNENDATLYFISSPEVLFSEQRECINEGIISAWTTPFGCWLASPNYAFFVYRYAMQEAQYRCLCRMLFWQQYAKK